MPRKRLHRQLFLTYLALILLCLSANGWLISRVLRQFYFDQLISDLKARIALVKEELEGSSFSLTTAALDSLCKTLGPLSSIRLTIINSTGLVLGDTEGDPARMANHADRPEFKAALSEGAGAAIRWSPTLQQKMVYYAVPVAISEQRAGAVRAAIPLASVNTALYQVYPTVALIGIILALMGGGFSYWFSRRISRPLTEMKKGAARFALGDFSHKVLVPQTEELAILAEALNQMAEQLKGRIQDLTRQRNELEAVLASMVEGVLAVDREERILNLNRSAREMLGLGHQAVIGRLLQEVVLNPGFQNFIGRVLAQSESLEEEILLQGGSLALQAHGIPLRESLGRQIGALVVLNDVTHLKHLENLRKEFVANVSHELRTPITTIKGFVETLQDGALLEADQASYFLTIISQHVDRLNALIEDLLHLSKLEQGAERGEVLLERGSLTEVIWASVQNSAARAAEKNIRLQVEAQGDFTLRINRVLLEQALMNLLDNAIKYSSPNSAIQVGLETSEKEFTLFVRDSGCGIAAEHLPRLFERFYRVDKDRSRELGGTGLGLAIVKHIALAHQGDVSVSSIPGQGSVFRLHLPR